MMKMMRTNPVSPALVIAARTCFQKQPLLQTSRLGFVSCMFGIYCLPVAPDPVALLAHPALHSVKNPI
jgi:hypothetical protein